MTTESYTWEQAVIAIRQHRIGFFRRKAWEGTDRANQVVTDLEEGGPLMRMACYWGINGEITSDWDEVFQPTPEDLHADDWEGIALHDRPWPIYPPERRFVN